MPQFGRRRLKPLQWTHWADGINTVDSPHRIGQHQAANGSVNAIFSPKSTKRRPNYFSYNAIFGGRMRGLWNYLNGSGVDRLIAINGGYVTTVDKNALTGLRVNIGTIPGDGETWFANSFGSCFLCNGAGVWKIEDDTLSQVGLTAPSGVVATAGSGGSLPDGEYQLFACYARKVDGVTVLYSKGEDLGTITLGSGNNKIAITNFPNTTNPQANSQAIFMSDANGSTYYLYYETSSISADYFDITSDANKNAAIIYSAQALDNNRPENFTQLVCHDKRLWGIKDDTLYYSIQASNKYDLERFPSEYFIKFPHRLTGLFVGGPHLFVNTDDGIIKIPYADPSVQPEHTEKRWNFEYPRTLAAWHGLIIGWTNDGIRAFDWEKGIFMSQELSRDIKPDIERGANSWGIDKQPCGVIYRRDERTEYLVSFADNDLGINGNNVTWALNLNRFALMADNEVRAPWEKWDIGFNYLTVDVDGTKFSAQSRSTSFIATEDPAYGYDTSVWIGDTYHAQYTPQMVIYTGRQVPDIRGKVLWGPLYTFAQFTKDWSVQIRTDEYLGPTDTEAITASSNVSLFGVARFGVDRFSSESPSRHKGKLKRNLKGYAVYLIITHGEDDKDYELLEILLEGMLTVSRYT